jgi:alpha,alpha-trehalase
MLRTLLILPIIVLLLACNADLPIQEGTDEVAVDSSESKAQDAMEQGELVPPDLLFGELFRRVQMEQLFDDGKTFVDMIPRMPAAEIMKNYRAASDKIDTNLMDFVLEHFDPPFDPNTTFQSDASRNIVDHINALWPVLTRRAGAGEGDAGSLIPLPKDYIVPGGRFREIYYWDSYFTMLGLKAAGEDQRIRDMVDNFAYLIEEIGFIPNGNRTYYLTRSQPPFFAAMVSLLVSIDGPSVYAKYLNPLRKEYDWWMEGLDTNDQVAGAKLHLVSMPDGSVLNRYYDRGDRPRAESYREDVLTIRESGRDSATVARHLRSGAESGWDYSSRWLADGTNLYTIETTDIIPVDLNALLYQTELTLELAYRNTQNPDMARQMQEKRKRRRSAIQAFLWNPATAWFEDVNWTSMKPTGRLSLAGMYPFFFDLAAEDQAESAFVTLKEKFLAPGGVRSTLVDSGQQWDNPNGWAPLQYMTVVGLEKYGNEALANDIRQRWLANNDRVYENVTKMVEKYNVEDLSLLAGGGEYPVQDGFGWSNGVYLALKQK